MLKKVLLAVICLITAGVVSAVELVKDGKPAASIVLAEKPTRAAQFAAFELQYHLQLLTGAKLEILRGKLPASGAKIFVGESSFTKGLKPFEFQEYQVSVKGDSVILAGCDEPDYGIVKYNSVFTFPDFWKKIATTYAVYDFLELIGIRWYLPTELGIAFVPTKNLKVADMMRRRKPTMEMRNMFVLPIPANLCADTISTPESKPALNTRDNRLWYYRRRHGGNEVIINHSMYTFYNRYLKTKPDWFAKGYGKALPAQLCYTHPEVIRQVSQDARDYFDGKLKAATQVLSNVPATYKSDVFPVFPMDNRSFCKCPNCIKDTAKHGVQRGKGQFSNDYSSEYLFKFVNEIAKELRKTHPDKLIGAGAYAGFAFPPKNFRLEDNIMLMMCLHTRLVFNEGICKNNEEMLNAWATEYPNMKKYVWMYWCFPTLEGRQQQFRIFPGFFAEKVGPIFRQYRKAGITGMFYEPSYTAWSQQSVLFDQVESAINWSLAWDESRDEKVLFDEFFELYYGPAAKPMKEWYRFAQAIYSKPAKHKHQTDEIAWKQLGTTENMAKLGKLMADAKKLATTQPYKARVELFEKGVWQYMQKGKKRGDELDALKAPSMQQCAVPCIKVSEPGNPVKVDWNKAAKLNFFGGLRAEPLKRKLDVRVAHDGTWIYFRATEENVDLTKLRKNNVVWLNDEWEFFFGKQRSKPYKQLGVDAGGKFAGVDQDGTVTDNWDFPGKVRVTSGNKWGSALFAIKLSDIVEGGIKPGEMLYGNIIRSNNGRAHGVWIPTFTGYQAADRFGELYIEPAK